MSSKRSFHGKNSQAAKKPRRSGLAKMTKGCKATSEGQGGGGAVEAQTESGVEGGGSVPPIPEAAITPPTCHLLQAPTKSPFDKKEYRVIRLGNGLRALLISDLSKKMSAEDNEDDDDEPEDLGEEEEEDSEEGSDEEEESEGDEEEEELEEEEGEGRSSGKGNQDTTKYLAAAALSVNVGSFEDPFEIPGLMHFLEHMVFMGSEKYPKENAFDYYIKKHGGRDNAHTDMEHTTFYFEVQERFLNEGLDRFAQFFIQPLMKVETMTREREAVHSEFQMAVPEDSYRTQQLFATLASDGHPMGKFTWGNESTLNVGIPDEELHKKLHELRLRYYSAHYMTLAVQARLSLDTLQEYVTSIFSQIPNNGLPCPSYKHLEFPFPVEKFHRLYRIIPMKEYHSVEINWALPSYLKHYKTKPLHYISHLLGHEGKGSILSYLKKKVWAVGLYSGNDGSGFEHNTTYAVMSISVELTDEGFKNLDEVLLVVFQYLYMIQQTGPVERIFREIQQTEKLNFDYAEEETAIDNVENLSEGMRMFEPEDYLTGDSLLFEYDPEVIKNCLQQLVPEKCNIMISSKSYEGQDVCCLTEDWFGTKYSVEDIPQEWVKEWSKPPENPHLFIPAANEFIPDNFDLLDVEEGTTTYPRILQKDDWGELLYKQDQKFKLPRTYCYIYFLSDLLLQSPRAAALLDLYLNLFQQHLMEDIYPANMAQYHYTINATERGLVFKINGFSQKLPQMLKLLLHHMDTFEEHLDEKSFQEIRQQQLKSYHNAIIKPENMKKNIRLSIVQLVHWTPYEKMKAIMDVTSKDLLEDFVYKIYPTCHIRMLVQGNTSSSEALDMYNLVKSRKVKLGKQDLPPFPEMRTMQLLQGCWIARLKAVNPADTNTSVINYYQGKEGTLMTEVLHEFIQMVMDEPVFDFLRTHEQLGYHVYCTNRNTYGILGISITVNTQANKFGVQHVDERIEAFLKEFVNTVRNLSDEELSSLKDTLTSMKQTVDLTLREEVDRNWGEITDGEYLFDRLQKQIELIKDITRDSVAECLENLVSDKNNEGYRKLTVQVVGASNPEDGTPPALDGLLGEDSVVKFLGPCDKSAVKDYPAEKFIMDIANFKQKLKAYPVTKIV
ncbi:nardilysin-like isoform X2 [Penaeus japonicus]|nr:nardilysin-like isoform X2 [Penaeus japonicus]